MRCHDSIFSPSRPRTHRRFKHFFTLFILSALLSCGAEDQDEGGVDTDETVSGIAIDPYIMNATVYIDTNENGVPDSWEPKAKTDEDGYFSVSRDGVDYCADSEAEEFKYCLLSTVDTPSALIRVIGGYDSVTEEPFSGELSVRVNNLGVGDVVISNVITPLTTLASIAETEEDRAALLSLLGIEESDLDVDYLEENQEGNVRTDLLSIAEKIFRAFDIVADFLDSYYDELGENENLPTNSAGILYSNIRSFLSENDSSDLNSILSESALRDIVAGAENDIANLYTKEKLDLPGVKITSEEGEGLFADKLNNMFTRIAQVLNLVDDIYPADTPSSAEEAFARIRLVEVVQQRIKEENKKEDFTTLDNNIDLFINLATDAGNANRAEFLNRMERDDVDINALVVTDFGNDEATVLNKANYSGDVTPFSSLSGKKLLVNDPDNFTGRRKHARAELYFEGDDLSTSGGLAMCIKTLSGDAAVGDNINSLNNDLLESGDTYGRYVQAGEGRWRILPSGYSVLIEIDFAGGTYSAILKTGGTTGEGDALRHIFRFDLDDDLESWSSVNGLVSQDGTEPTTDDNCKQRFIAVAE